MTRFKSILIVWLFVLSIVLVGLNLKASPPESRWVEVFFGETLSNLYNSPNLNHEYSEYWDKRPNGIGMLKMDVKLLPNLDSSKDSFLIGYRAEIALNSQAEKLKEWEPKSDDFISLYTKQRYRVGFFFSLHDEDGFYLSSIYTENEETKRIYTRGFLHLTPGEPQIEQAIINSNELAPQLAKRIKKVKVTPVLTRLKQ